MIAINLLPEDRRPVRGTPLPRFMVIVSGVVCVSLEVLLLIVLYLRMPALENQQQLLRGRKDYLQKQVDQVEAIDKKIGELQVRRDSVEKLVNDRRRWAPILYVFSDPEIVPKGVWFKRLTVKMVSSGRGAEATVLEIEGLASGGTNDASIKAMTELVRNLEVRLPETFEGRPIPSDVRQVMLAKRDADVPVDAPATGFSFTLTIPLKDLAAAAAPARRARR